MIMGPQICGALALVKISVRETNYKVVERMSSVSIPKLGKNW